MSSTRPARLHWESNTSWLMPSGARGYSRGRLVLSGEKNEFLLIFLRRANMWWLSIGQGHTARYVFLPVLKHHGVIAGEWWRGQHYPVTQLPWHLGGIHYASSMRAIYTQLIVSLSGEVLEGSLANRFLNQEGDKEGDFSSLKSHSSWESNQNSALGSEL